MLSRRGLLSFLGAAPIVATQVATKPRSLVPKRPPTEHAQI